MTRAILAAVLFLAGAGAASAQAVDHWTDEAIMAALEANGATDIEQVNVAGEPPFWAARVGGLQVLLNGSSCDANAQNCKGLYLAALFSFEGDVADKQAHVAEMNGKFAALKASQYDDGSWIMSRYEILDGGRSPESLAASIGIFADLTVEAAFPDE